MNSKALEYITSYGGKGWILRYFYDYYPALHPNLPPIWLIKYGEEVSQKVYKALLGSREDSPNILVRCSHQKDRFWLVDFLPTMMIPDPDWKRSSSFLNNNRGEFQKSLDCCLENWLRPIHEKYKPDLHIILTPYLKHTLYTVTEHPNQPDHLFVDTGRMGTIFWREVTEIVKGKVLAHEPWTRAQQILKLTEKVRSLNVFDANEKLQYEIWVTTHWKLYIFQVKKFSDTFPELPLEALGIKTPVPWWTTRIMGKLPSTNDVFYHMYDDHLDAIRNVCQEPHPSVLFSSLHANPWVSFEVAPPNLKGFISEIQSALFHNLTAPVQAVLQNDWFALLNYSPPRYTNQLVSTRFDKGDIYWERFTSKKKQHWIW